MQWFKFKTKRFITEKKITIPEVKMMVCQLLSAVAQSSWLTDVSPNHVNIYRSPGLLHKSEKETKRP